MTRIQNANRYGALDLEALAGLETWAGRPFPAEYREFLTRDNGGVPDPAGFPGGRVDCLFALHDVLWDENSPGGPHAYPLQAAVVEWVESLPDRDDLPIGRTRDGRWITIAVTGVEMGAIRCVDPEFDVVYPNLSPSFGEFLALLREPDGEEAQ